MLKEVIDENYAIVNFGPPTECSIDGTCRPSGRRWVNRQKLAACIMSGGFANDYDATIFAVLMSRQPYLGNPEGKPNPPHRNKKRRS